uniref:C-type lectin domain-containing protein n=1 Tax=Neolamprologus brichardi TaxID=32507 RepID=A0A3Q4N9N0_NEOBR
MFLPLASLSSRGGGISSWTFFSVFALYIFIFIFFSGGLSTLPPHSREYHFVNQLMNWTEAQSYCREHFTDLVTIYNSDINQLLLSMSPRIRDWAWIGLYDDPYSWKWSMEEKLYYLDAKEYCVALQGQTQMNDRPCGDSYPFLPPPACFMKMFLL